MIQAGAIARWEAKVEHVGRHAVDHSRPRMPADRERTAGMGAPKKHATTGLTESSATALDGKKVLAPEMT
jgi:hypothetical protein